MSLKPDLPIAQQLPVGERHPEAKLTWIDISPQTEPAVVKSPVDAAIEAVQQQILDGGHAKLADELLASGLLSRDNARRFRSRAKDVAAAIKQAAANDAVTQGLAPGQTAGLAWGQLPALGPSSQQFSLEDLYTSLDFIPIPGITSLEVYEQEFFEENHIDGTLVERTALSVTKRGHEFRRYETAPDISGKDADAADAAEIAQLEDWFEQVNEFRTFNQIVQRWVASAEATNNAYLEVMPDSNNYDRTPVGLEVVRSSSIRWIRGHRALLQYTAGVFRWFNSYTWNEEDRKAGQALWEEYWRERDIDPYSDEFRDSPWSRTINSQMPAGVWNPYCNELIPWNGLSLESKYYGFPKSYRIGKLHALLQAALDYNIALQQNNFVGPFILQFHGELDNATRDDLINYFRGLKGPQNFGRVPFLQAPAPIAGPQGAVKTGGLEIVRIADDGKDGVFLELWKMIRQDIAMVRAFPLDLLTTENSNRATIEIAEQLFDDNVVRPYHEALESLLKRLTRYDLGFKNHYLHFRDMDINLDGEMQKMQIATGYREAGLLNANEARSEYMSKGPRPGGEQYIDFRAGPGSVEDEVSEEEETAAADAAESGSKKTGKTTKAADTQAGQQGAEATAGSESVQQSRPWWRRRAA